MPDAFVGLGSNVGDRAGFLRDAVARLALEVSVAQVSSVYETEAVGPVAQGPFLNAVLRVRTELPPVDVLAVLRSIEDGLGRQRTVPQGPRTIDLDLLLYGDTVVESEGLILPHPGVAVRRFVLEPLAEIAPQTRLGRGGPTVGQALAALPKAESVRRLSLAGWPPEGAPRGAPED